MSTMSEMDPEAEKALRPASPMDGAPPRTVETVTLEIRTLQRQAQQIMLGYAVEIGRRLEEVKAMLPHGQWGDYLKNEVDYSQSTANNFMRIYREYGAAQQSLFGGETKSQAFANLTYTKALRLLAIPDEEEREQFIAGHDVAGMSNRELDKALKEREEALKAAAAARGEAQEARQEANQLRKDLQWKEDALNQQQEALDRQSKKANQLQNALSKANAAAQEARDEQDRLARELEELRARPIDVAVEVDQEAVEAARKAAVAEMEEKLKKAKDAEKKAEEKRKAAEEALESTRKELAELKAKGPEVRALTQEEKEALTAGAVEQARAESAERLRGLEKRLAQADPDTAAFKVLFDSWQETYEKMIGVLNHVARADGERAAKLRQAVKAALEQMAAF